MCVCVFLYICLQKNPKYHKIIFNAIKWFYTPLQISSLFQPSYVSLTQTKKSVEMNGFQFCFVSFFFVSFNWFTGIFEKVVKDSLDREAWHAEVQGGLKESDTTEWLNWTTCINDLWSRDTSFTHLKLCLYVCLFWFTCGT